MANLTALITRVRDIIEDSGGTFITDAEITRYLNEGMLDLAARLRLLQAESSGTTSGSSISLPADFVAAISLRLGTDDVEFVDDDTFWMSSDDGTTPVRTLGRVFNDTIELYPTPSTGTAYKLRYSKKPTALATGTDTPALPEELHRKLVFYAASLVRLKEEAEGHADRYMAMYEDGLPALSPRERIIPGPITLSFVAGPFDNPNEHVHI